MQKRKENWMDREIQERSGADEGSGWQMEDWQEDVAVEEGLERELKKEKTYDAAFWTALVQLREYAVPLINALFDEHYTEAAKVRIKNNRHSKKGTSGEIQELESDGYMEIEEKEHAQDYHMECEAWFKHGYVLKVERYGSSIASENAVLEGDVVNVYHPKSAVIFLHADKNIPERYLVRHWHPDRNSYLEYEVRTIQMADLTLQEIFQKKLLVLLPMYAFLYKEEELREINEDRDKLRELEDSYEWINRRLIELVDKGELEMWQHHMILELMARVFAKAAIKYSAIQKGVRKIMGRYIIRTWTDELMDIGRQEGRAEGRAAGIEEGKEEGIQEGTERLSKLILFLLSNGRDEDVSRVAKDAGYREKMFAECGV